MQTNFDIAQAIVQCDKQKIYSIYLELVKERNKLDKWFNKYLDMFSEKMSDADKKDPMWKLYDAKSEQYSRIMTNIKTAEFYLK